MNRRASRRKPWVAEHADYKLQIASRPAGAKDFVLLPKRCVAERWARIRKRKMAGARNACFISVGDRVESDAVDASEPVWYDAELAERLSRIKTLLSVWLQAHEGQGEASVAARQQLVFRYYGAVYRYLLGKLCNAGAAEELTQEFAVRFLRGDFKHFNPQRGRFRDFLKSALRHPIVDYWRYKQRKASQPLPVEASEALAQPPPEDEFDREFLAKWKEELLARTWEALEKNQEQSGAPYYTVLRCKTERPETRSAELATEVGARLGKPQTKESARQLVHRARKRFAELLVEEVARSLESAEPEQVSEELIELGLMGYCRVAVPDSDRMS